MEILTEFDELQEAMKKINLNESIMPYINGILCDAPSYNKVQKILDCPEMISAHKYLYDLDLDQLSEEEIGKIDKLYKLGVDRGFIQDDLTDWDKELAPADAAAEKIVADELKKDKPVGGTLFKAKVPCWTVIYSAASKDGQIKTGEAYSNAISASAAKADVKAKLSSVGYSNITILAIESCEADVEVGSFSTEESEEVEENDMLHNRSHNAHISAPLAEADDDEDSSEDDSSDDDSSDDGSSEDSKDDSAEDESEDDGADDSEDASDDESADDSDDSTEDSGDDSSDDSSDDATDDAASEEESKDDEEKNDDAESEDDSSDDAKSDEDGEDKELDANQKADLKDKYKKTFKNTLVKCKFENSFNDLTLEQKVKFFTELSKAWKKNEPNEFMTDKEIEQLNNVVVKPNDEEQ